MIEHSLNSQNNFILGAYIDAEVCDVLLDAMLTNNEWSDSKIFELSGYQLPAINQDKQAFIKHHWPLLTRYFEQVMQVFSIYKQRYEYADQGQQLFEIKNFNLQRYEPGFHYKNWHYENQGLPEFISRHLTFMTYLNTIDDGGETEFFYQKLKVKPEKGLTLIWPAQWTHTHRGLSTNEVKYIMTGWFDYTAK